MRWRGKYKNNQVVRVKKFALTPKQMSNTGEWVWLEYYIRERTYYNGHWVFNNNLTIEEGNI